VTSGPWAPAAIALDADNVYWIASPAYGDTTVRFISRSGGSSVLLGSGAVGSAFALSSTRVFWDSSDGVVSVPKAGGTPVTIDTGKGTMPLGLAADDDNVYWAGTAQDFSAPQFTALVLVKATGGTYTLTVNGAVTAPIPWDATPDQVQAALTALAGVGPAEATVTGRSLGAVSVLNVTFGLAWVTMTSDGTDLAGEDAAVTADLETTYPTNSVLVQVPLSGAAPVTFASENLSSFFTLIGVGSEDVYWAQTGSAGVDVVKAPIGGGTTTTLVAGLDSPQCFTKG
jgi:hypothetical protein